MEILLDRQELYKKTGGVHTSMLFDASNFLLAAEDVGSHNTLDKLAGRCLLEQINPEHGILSTTGRISSEMLQKAFRLKASIIISRISPTNLSISLAHQYGLTLIGYGRRNSFNVYSHPERIQTVKEKQINRKIKDETKTNHPPY